MQRVRRHQHRSVWLAVFAILLMALAPTLSHALQGRQAEMLMAVCSAQGTRYIAADAGMPGAPADSHTAPVQPLEHCPWCHLQGADGAVPPAPAALHLQVPQAEVPRLFLVAPRTQHAWLAAQPRAPPARG
jgi:Protein of unknown function (DUF2946)